MTADLQKVEDLWFPDGNVIIRAGERICRVYKGFLTSQSPVLADMFSIPQPPDAQTMDGLPVVVFPDAPEDVLHWLKAMLFPRSFEAYPVKIEMHQLFAVLRLSHKYDVQHLRRRALYHLSTVLPTELATKFPLRGDMDASIIISYCGDHDCHAFLLNVVPLVHEIGAVWLLPAALYQLHTAYHIPYNPKISLVALTDALPAIDVARLWRIAHALPRAFPHSLTDKWTVEDCKYCVDLSGEAIEGTYQSLLTDPLEFYGPADEMDDDESSDYESYILIVRMCSPCYREARKDYRGMAQRFWDALPGLLELPTWEELRAMKASDVGTTNTTT
ncbi:hypothetical protein BD626DRAFT_441327 [Schizophyllum amplum]|uniref:BTB domain-containing protein n=1 Tax=Schizophyllum amplum TaxID=97359 RepID=A0A550BUK9_9AGAR|nr:hypothetical protein BD626DRAFT_441327 [Auriculariopsis ampla]